MRSVVGIWLSVAVLCAACSVSVERTGDSPSPTQTAAPAETPATPTVGPAEVSWVWPADRPADFSASFNQDGGMAPWSEAISVSGDTAEYEVWMSEVTYSFSYSPSPERLDGLYETFRAGRFETYAVIPFEDGDQIYDAETTAWSASFGDESHRVRSSGERIVSANQGPSPLTHMSDFVDTAEVPAATNPVTVMFDAGDTAPPNQLQIHFDLGDSEFAMGDERWSEEFDIYWSGAPAEIPVTVTARIDGEQQIIGQSQVVFEADGRLLITVSPLGDVAVSSG